jgi:hypothetical protein
LCFAPFLDLNVVVTLARRVNSTAFDTLFDTLTETLPV